jgi:hypothetical protein
MAARKGVLVNRNHQHEVVCLVVHRPPGQQAVTVQQSRFIPGIWVAPAAALGDWGTCIAARDAYDTRRLPGHTHHMHVTKQLVSLELTA